MERMAAYAEREVAGGERLSAITRHMLGMCAGRPGARRFRQWLSESSRALGVGVASAFEASRLLREGAALCADTDA
jgi:tRNA-dihydrouridine synthase A